MFLRVFRLPYGVWHIYIYLPHQDQLRKDCSCRPQDMLYILQHYTYHPILCNRPILISSSVIPCGCGCSLEWRQSMILLAPFLAVYPCFKRQGYSPGRTWGTIWHHPVTKGYRRIEKIYYEPYNNSTSLRMLQIWLVDFFRFLYIFRNKTWF